MNISSCPFSGSDKPKFIPKSNPNCDDESEKTQNFHNFDDYSDQLRSSCPFLPEKNCKNPPLDDFIKGSK